MSTLRRQLLCSTHKTMKTKEIRSWLEDHKTTHPTFVPAMLATLDHVIRYAEERDFNREDLVETVYWAACECSGNKSFCKEYHQLVHEMTLFVPASN